MRFLGPLLLLAGCHAASVQPDAAIDGDGGSPARGLFVAWHAKPMLPGAIAANLTVTEATFQVEHLQVISDAGSEMTTHAKYQLRWNSDGRPMAEMFHDAPVAVYSRISLSLMRSASSEYSIEIKGVWNDDGEEIPFEIEDDLPLNVMVDCDETLPAAGWASLAIEVDLRDAIGGINWKNVELDDGELELDSGPELAGFHERLRAAFRLDGD